MAPTDAIDLIMGEVGALDDGIVAVVRTPDERWVIQFEEADIEAELDGTGRLMLSVLAGTPHPSRALAVYETLLSYTALWRETGGVRMALTGRGGAVIQMVDLSVADLRPERVVTVAVNLASRAAIWRAFVESPERDAPVPAFDDDHSYVTMIRV